METIDFYDSDPGGYAAKTFSADISDSRDRFVRLMPEGARILDLGCGSGRDTVAFRELGFSVEPVDGSEGMVAQAERNTGAPVRHLLFRDLDYEDEFDGVWACSTLLHVHSDELPDIIGKVRRSLRDGGVFYLSFKKGTFEGMRDGRYFHDMEADGVRALAESAGFAVLEVWESSELSRRQVWVNALVRK